MLTRIESGLWLVRKIIRPDHFYKTKVYYLCINSTVKSDDSILASGAGDSALILWKDVTKEEREAAAAEKEKRILEEQQLANLMQQGLLLDALALAVRLDQPFRCLNILKGLSF